MKGIVVFMEMNKDSKSQGSYPFLYLGNGEFVRVFFVEDNPFENETLKELDGKRVELIGDYNDNGDVFLAEEINTVTEETTEE